MNSSRGANMRSPSSIQLLGKLESTIGLGVPSESEDDCELRVKGHETLNNACTSVLSCILLLRRIIRKYAYGRMGRELQHLSLTVASFERVLYTFIKEEILEASSTHEKQPMDLSSKPALKDIMPLIPTHERFPLLSGGIGSLLRHATKSLNETKQVLEELQTSYDPNREARWSLSSIAIVFTLLYIYRRYRHQTTVATFVRFIMPSRHTIKYMLLMAVAADQWQRLLYRFSNLRRIKCHHAKLLMALRLFLLCEHVLQRARPVDGSSPEQRLLISSPVAADIDDDLKNATTLLVERVPLPAEYYDRSSEPWGFIAFKIGTNVLTSSSALTHSLLGLRNKKLLTVFRSPLMLLAIPYYILRHQKAARYTSRTLIDHPNVDVIRASWRLYGESRLVRLLMWCQCPKLAVFDYLYVHLYGQEKVYATSSKHDESDVGVYVLSARPMESVQLGTWKGASTALTDDMIAMGLPMTRPVLVYIHGGGFFGRFIGKDWVTLSTWAKTLGAVVVYIDYGLAPETHYPDSLNQCMGVYKWIVGGGLGFKPTRVALFGESAGANMAAALCIQCIQENVPLPRGNVFMFPALNLHLSPSPSRFLHQSDPVLPRGILELALNSYYPSHGHESQYKENIHDPCVSPGLAEDDLLRQFPPTCLLVGDLDPLLDDSVDFHTRLSHLGVPSNLKIYSGLSHGFIIYGDLVPEAQQAIDDTCDRVQRVLSICAK